MQKITHWDILLRNQVAKKEIINPLGVIICSKINGLDIGQDTEIQYLEVVKQANIYVKYSKKLF